MSFVVADIPGKVVEGCFSSEKSIGHPKQLTVLSRAWLVGEAGQVFSHRLIDILGVCRLYRLYALSRICCVW